MLDFSSCQPFALCIANIHYAALDNTRLHTIIYMYVCRMQGSPLAAYLNLPLLKTIALPKLKWQLAKVPPSNCKH